MPAAFQATNKADGTSTGLTLSVTSSSQRVALPTSPGYQLRLQAEAGSTIFIKFGDSSVTATSADRDWDYAIPGGIVEVVSFLETDTDMAYSVASGTQTLRISRGQGL